MCPVSQITNEFIDVLTDNYLNGTVTVGTSAVEAKVGTTKLQDRELLIIHNSSNNTIYHGASNVTVNTGVPIFKNQTVYIAAQQSVYLIASSSNNTVVVQELS